MLGLVCFTYGLVHAIAGQIPQLDPAHRHVERNGYIYAGDGKTILAVLRGDQARVIVSSDQIAPIMKQAIVAIEDRRFYEHRGIDMRGMVRAVWADVRHNKVVQGGSTITQQFVKNSYITNERSIGRKLKEAALAWQAEQADVCAGCGHPHRESMDPENQGAYTASLVICHACAARDEKARSAENPPAGAMYRTTFGGD